MIDDTGTQVLPSAFMPAAERFGLMPEIDRWVMCHAFAHHASLQVATAGARTGTICAISISASALNDPLFIDYINALFDAFGLQHNSICFEIAETTAIAHLAKAMRFIDAFKPHGCRFALDDFGSGMSSFAYLTHLQVDFLKIDGAFIMDMAKDPIDRAKVEAINHVGHAMGILTIAKHVQDQQTIDRLRAIRVDHAQGGAIAEPVPVPQNTGLPQVRQT